MSKTKFVLLYSLLMNCLFVQGGAYHMQRIDSRAGLSNSAVLSIYQDEKGFMWVGTYNGLNRYDGKFIESFGLEDDNDSVQSSNIIQNIHNAGDNCLWLSTYIGFNKFSIDQNRVVEHYPAYQFPYNLASNNKGVTCLVAKRHFISVYDKMNKHFVDIPSPDIDPLTVITTFIDSNNDLWVFTSNNVVWKIKVKVNNLAKNPRTVLNPSRVFISNAQVVAAFEENGLIFYVDKSGDLYTYDVDRKRNNYIRNIQGLLAQYGSISSIITYHDDFWISFKGNGLMKLVTARKYAEEILDLSSGVFCLHKDRKQDVVWIGSDGQGVVIYSKKSSIFNSIKSESLPFQVRKPIRSIFTDKYNTLWIGTKGDGLLRIKDYEKFGGQNIPAANVTHYVTHDGLSNNQVFSIVASKYYNLNWLATEGPGISYFSYADQRIYTMQNLTDIPVRAVHSLVEENDSTLWLATSGYSLIKVLYKKAGSKYVIYKVKPFDLKRDKRAVVDLFSLLNDNKGYLWIGSRGDGVICFRLKDGAYWFVTSGKHVNSPVDDVIDLCKSKRSYFYAGSCAGLLRYSNEKGVMKLLEIPNKNRIGLKEMIHGMQEDKTGCLWMSTNRGLEKYNPTNNVFHKYIKNSGLDVIEFSDNADYKCPYSDRIFFGGIDGIVWIEQNLPDDKAITPKIQFTGLKMNGTKARITDFLKHNDKGDYLELHAGQNSFSVAFIAIDFVHGSNIEYSYQLENYSDEWISADELNEARFTSLPPGHYKLNVKYKYDVFDTESESFSLPIVILPPWYLSGVAWFVYFLILVTIAFFLVRYFRAKAILKQQEFHKAIMEKNREDLYETKMKFFTNITHEFLTPLTLILGPCDRILEYKHSDDYVKKYASLLKQNINRLQLLIHEIINFSKREEFGQTSCNIEKVSLNDVAQSINLAFSETVERSKVDFRIEIEAGLWWNTDISCLNKILMNLISNAFKYTPSNGKIDVSFKLENDELTISVYNTGKGIREDEIMKVFDRFRILDNMEENAYMDFSSRNGLGLAICYSMIQQLKGSVDVKSEVNNYTEFIVKLPVLKLSNGTADLAGSSSAQSEESDFEFVATDVNKENQLNKKTILVVDDNKEIVWMVAELLQEKYHIVKAFNAQEAFDVIDANLPDLIVADLMMPGELDGSDLVKRLKSNKFTSHVPIIIISAKNSIEDQILGLEYGADFYLAKPFNLSYLRTTIDQLIEKKSVLKEYYNSPLSAVDLKGGQLIHHEEQAFLNQVTVIIEKNLGQGELRPEFIAEQLKLSSQGFYRKLKAITSLSPSDFIKQYRFSVAAKLLLSSNLSVQEVIYKVGVNNRSYFYREFAKIYNTTPKEYRLVNGASVENEEDEFLLDKTKNN